MTNRKVADRGGQLGRMLNLHKTTKRFWLCSLRWFSFPHG
jgi:hypothetical protein